MFHRCKTWEWLIPMCLYVQPMFIDEYVTEPNMKK